MSETAAEIIERVFVLARVDEAAQLVADRFAAVHAENDWNARELGRVVERLLEEQS